MLMMLYLGVVFIGYIVGAKLRKKDIELTWIGKIQMACIFLLVFMMGSRIGSNKEVVSSLGTIGVIALVLTLLAFAGSLICTIGLRKFLKYNRRGERE